MGHSTVATDKRSLETVADWSFWDESWRFRRLLPSECAPPRHVFGDVQHKAKSKGGAATHVEKDDCLEVEAWGDLDILKDPRTCLSTTYDLDGVEEVPLPTEFGFKTREGFPEVSQEDGKYKLRCLKRGAFQFEQSMTNKKECVHIRSLADYDSNNHNCFASFPHDNFGACFALLHGRSSSPVL